MLAQEVTAKVLALLEAGYYLSLCSDLDAEAVPMVLMCNLQLCAHAVAASTCTPVCTKGSSALTMCQQPRQAVLSLQEV